MPVAICESRQPRRFCQNGKSCGHVASASLHFALEIRLSFLLGGEIDLSRPGLERENGD